MPDILEGLFLNPAYCLLKTSGSTKTAVMALEIASPLGSKTGSLKISEGELRHCSLHSAVQTHTKEARPLSQPNTVLLLLTASSVQQLQQCKMELAGSFAS